MERTQKEWFSIFDHHRQVMLDRLELLQRFEQFLLQLPDGAYTAEQQEVMAEDMASARASLAYLEKCQREAAEGKLVIGIPGCTPARRKKSRNRGH